MKKCLLAVLAISLLSGCTSLHKAPARSMADKMQAGTPAGVTPDLQCAKDFGVLKGLNGQSFAELRGQFDEINRVYAVYQREATKLGKDPKELLSMELGSKLNQVCARVKYNVYTEIQKKLTPVSDM